MFGKTLQVLHTSISTFFTSHPLKVFQSHNSSTCHPKIHENPLFPPFFPVLFFPGSPPSPPGSPLAPRDPRRRRSASWQRCARRTAGAWSWAAPRRCQAWRRRSASCSPPSWWIPRRCHGWVGSGWPSLVKTIGKWWFSMVNNGESWDDNGIYPWKMVIFFPVDLPIP